MKDPFNSQAPHFLTKVKTYCAKVLPLVFDNSLSYYEFLGKVCHKLNECIDALNSQNLNIIEFTHMVQLEIENFEKYIDNRITEFEDELKKAWEEYKEELNKAFADFKNEMLTAWEEEKAINEKFRTDLLNDFNSFKTEITTQQERFETQIKADFNTYKETVNAEIEQFEQATNADLSAFKNTMQTQQNEFENHMVELFNNFKTTEKQARTDFESNFQQLFEQWKIDTLNAFNSSITSWESETGEALKKIIDGKFSAYQTTMASQLSETNRHLTLEVNDRKAADENLQNQINQLTPEGAIKADTPDSNGNSQLYTVNPTTQERTNIFPVTNNSGGTGETPEGAILNNGMYGDSKSYTILAKQTESGNKNILPVSPIMPVYLSPNTNRSESYLKAGGAGRGVMWHYLFNPDNGPFVNTKGATDLGNAFINIPISKLYYEITSPEDFFGRHRITHYFYVDNDANNLLTKCKPTINYYWARIENGYFKCGVMLHCSNETSSIMALTGAKMYTCVDEYLYAVI